MMDVSSGGLRLRRCRAHLSDTDLPPRETHAPAAPYSGAGFTWHNRTFPATIAPLDATLFRKRCQVGQRWRKCVGNSWHGEQIAKKFVRSVDGKQKTPHNSASSLPTNLNDEKH